MSTFSPSNSEIHILVRAVLFCGEKIVLCRAKGADRFFLPGGHVENGELAREALLRELKEEIGDHEYKIGEFVGVCEGIFPREDGIFQQEVNIVFFVTMPSKKIVSQEDHLEFVSVSRSEIHSYNIVPKSLKEGLLEWMKNGTPFLKSFREE